MGLVVSFWILWIFRSEPSADVELPLEKRKNRATSRARGTLQGDRFQTVTAFFRFSVEAISASRS
jgi:hypothetical protein